MSWTLALPMLGVVNITGQFCNLLSCCLSSAVHYEEEEAVELSKRKQLSMILIMCWHLCNAVIQSLIVLCTSASL